MNVGRVLTIADGLKAVVRKVAFPLLANITVARQPTDGELLVSS